MPARWLFVLIFFAYLFGPSRAGEPESRIREGPVLAAIAARPVAAVLRAIYPLVPPDDRTRWTGRLVCALCTAGGVALTFLTLRRFAPMEGALLLAVTAAFASPLWSWTSRSDMSGAAATLVVAALLWLSIGRTERASRLANASDLALGALAAVLIILGTPSLVGAAPSAHFDATVLAGYLVSPGRGLVFFAPLAVLVIAALLRGSGPRRVVWGGALVWLAVLVDVAWRRAEPWGPLGFGPTILAPYVPLLAVMAAGLPKAWLRAGALLSIPAALAHGAAVFVGGHTWDERRMVVHHPEAVWDLSDSPFSDLAFGPPRPDPADFAAASYFMRPGDHATRAGHPLPWLAYGWEEPEPTGVWASGRESWIVLATPPGDYVLTLTAAAPRRRRQGQRLEIERPGDPPLELTFSKDLWELEPLSIPFRADRNVTVLKLRPAHTWIPGHGDVRRCSVFAASLRLQEARVP